MKKLFLIPLLMLAFVIFPGVSRADNNNSSISEDTIEDIVDKVLELDEAGKTRAEIITAVDDMLDASDDEDDTDDDSDDSDDDDDDDDDDEDDNDKSNKGKSGIKKINFGQTKKMIKKGENSEDVVSLQAALNAIAANLGLNFNILIVDGKYGPATVQVVKMIQAHQQILSDGVVGPTTLAKLQALLDQVATNVAPVITLTGDASMTILVGATFTDPGAIAADAEDGNLTSSIVTTGTVNTATAGTYTLKYNVKDSDEKPAVEVSRTVIVQ